MAKAQTKPKEYLVNTKLLNVRVFPEGPVCGMLTFGTKIVSDPKVKRKGWIKIRDGYYVNSRFLLEVNQNG